MKSRLCVLALAAWVLVFPSGAQAQKTQPADYVVAIVNSEPITFSELRGAMLRVTEQLKSQGQALPPKDELQKGVLERLISDRAQLQLAAETGIRIEDAAIDLAEQNLARQNKVDVEAFRQRMEKRASPLPRCGHNCANN